MHTGWVPASQANVFISNHDSERVRIPALCSREPSSTDQVDFLCRASGNLLPSSHSNAYVLASVFTLAHSYGTPTVLLSYSFSNIDACAPNGSYRTCSGGSGANGWLCQHRLLEIAGMVGFHNAVAGAPMTNWVAPEAQRVAFGRGMSSPVVARLGFADRAIVCRLLRLWRSTTRTLRGSR